jgi:hypothetical protein
MFKSSSLENRYFHLSIKNSVKSKWFALLILFPLAAYTAFHMLEGEAVSFVSHLFPSEPYKSTGFYDDLLNLVFSEVLWITGFLFLTWIFVVYVPLLKVINRAERYAMTHSAIYVFVVISASFVLSVFISDRALQTGPLNVLPTRLMNMPTCTRPKPWATASCGSLRMTSRSSSTSTTSPRKMVSA